MRWLEAMLSRERRLDPFPAPRYAECMRPALLVMALLALSAGPALAGDRESARDHYVKGTRAYELGLFDEAIAEYMAAYKIKDDPALLFDIGQAHRLAGHPAEALRFYKTYLSKIPAAPNRAEVEAKMAELTRQLEQQKPSPAEPSAAPSSESPAPSLPVPEPVAASPRSGGPVVTPATIVQSSPRESAGRGMRIAGITSAAGGLALLGTGIAFAVLAKRAANDLTQLDASQGVFDPSKQDAGQRDQILADVLIGVGAATLVTGAILYVSGARAKNQTSRALVVSPSLAAHSAGATLRMVF